MEIEVFKLHQRLAELKGQRAMADTEISLLENIPCPVCKNGQIERAEKEGAGGGTRYFDICQLCDGTGKAAGRR